MSQTDPYNTMVLHFVAKLKDIGAQLARKSTRSPSLSLYQTIPAEAALAALEPSAAAPLSPKPLPRQGFERSDAAGTGEPAPLATAISPSTIDIVSAAAEQEAEEEAGEESAIDQTMTEPGEEEGFSDDEETAEDADAEEDPEPIDCKGDCTDLFTDSSNNPMLQQGNSIGPEQVGAGFGPSGDKLDSSDHYTLPTAVQSSRPNYAIPANPYESPSTNELFPYIQVQPEYIERQSSAAYSSRIVGAPHLLTTHLIVCMAATLMFAIDSIRKRALVVCLA